MGDGFLFRRGGGIMALLNIVIFHILFGHGAGEDKNDIDAQAGEGFGDAIASRSQAATDVRRKFPT